MTTLSEYLTNELNEKRCVKECEFEYIYHITWFMNCKSKRPYNEMFYASLEKIHYVFDCCAYREGLVKVEVVKVCKNSNAYKSAITLETVESVSI